MGKGIRLKLWLKVLLLIAVVAMLSNFLMAADWEKIGHLLVQMPLAFLGFILVSFLAYSCATWTWILCLPRHISYKNFGRLFMARHVGEMLSVFNPTSVIAGETLKVHYLHKLGIKTKPALASILLSRVMIIISAILMMLVSLAYLIFVANHQMASPAITILGLMAGIFLVLGIGKMLISKSLILGRLMHLIQKSIGKKIVSDRIVAGALETNQFMSDFFHKNSAAFFGGLLLSCLHWILGASEFFIMLRAMDIDISIWNAIVIEMGVIFFKGIGAMVPGQLGVEEYANKLMLDVVGVGGADLWVVVSIMRRARQLFWIGMAFIFMLVLKIKNEKPSKIL